MYGYTKEHLSTQRKYSTLVTADVTATHATLKQSDRKGRGTQTSAIYRQLIQRCDKK
jgi:hypothetical protein